ncbi:MAG TPA: ABC-F type ribosomal protection protein [Virgibacillus sp.]|nr:ABC-F type ribosomal protection protein [Virgibacillus sp.]
MIICSADNIAKMYGGNMVFENLSLEINEKERVGLVGRNGSGKTTLIRLLAGEESPDSGKIHWKKGARTGYLSQIPECHDMTLTKDVLKSAFSSLIEMEIKMKEIETHMSMETAQGKLEKLMDEYGKLQQHFMMQEGYEIDYKIEKIAQGLNISPLLDHPFSRLSGGEQTKVGLGLMLLEQPDLLLLDEPTNHLDLMAVEWLGHFLQEYEGTVLVISHDRYFLDEVINKVIDLEDGEVTTYQTDFTGFVKEKEDKLLREFKAYEEQQKKVKKMKEAIKRLRDWANRANPPNADLHRRARNMERALERMKKLNRPVMNRRKMKLEMAASERSGNDVITLEDVAKSFGDKRLFQNVDMHIMYQDRVAIIGENGTGKSTLLKLILQELEPDHGDVKVGSNVKVGYLSQHIFSDIEDDTVIEVFRDDVRMSEGEARQFLARFMFYGYAVFRKVSQLSGGERMRLRLAQLMCKDINLLILDEPTNHLDIESREVLEDTLDDFQGSLLAVSHDRYLIDKLFEKIYWIESKEIHFFNGDYTWAREKMVQLRENTSQKKVKESTNSLSPQKENKNNESLESKMAFLEQSIEVLDKKLMVIDDLELLQTLYKEKQDLELEWEKVCDMLES